MNRHELICKINAIYNSFTVPTPQIDRVAGSIISTIDENEFGSLQVILGEVGCGVSTAINICRKKLRRRPGATILLRPSGLHEHNSPWKHLLESYGLTTPDLTLRGKGNSTPLPVVDLIRHASIRCIIIEDFLEGLITHAEKQKMVNAWVGLTQPPTSVSIVISASTRAFEKLNTDIGKTTIHHIPEWKDDILFAKFVATLSTVLSMTFNVHLNLENHTETLFKFCQGNTGNLIRLVREYAIQALLISSRNQNSERSEHSEHSAHIEYLPLKHAVQKNAFLFINKTCP